MAPRIFAYRERMEINFHANYKKSLERILENNHEIETETLNNIKKISWSFPVQHDRQTDRQTD